MNGQSFAQQQVLTLLDSHVVANQDDAAALAEFKAFAAAHPDCCERTFTAGHFTGSAWLVSADGGRVLLTHHRKLNRWLQLGGHADGDGDLAAVALREAEEESGLSRLLVEGGIFDLDLHLIPARGSEPAHWHHDVRFVVRATDDEYFVANEESNELAWRSIGELADDGSMDDSLRRMALRWLERT